MAAGTAAALVPIRSITRKLDPSSSNSMTSLAKDSPRLSSTATDETVTYVAAEQDDAGPLCLKLLAQLKAIQLGKVKDEFGWCFAVSGEDGTKVAGEKAAESAEDQTVDQME